MLAIGATFAAGINVAVYRNQNSRPGCQRLSVDQNLLLDRAVGTTYGGTSWMAFARVRLTRARIAGAGAGSHYLTVNVIDDQGSLWVSPPGGSSIRITC